MESKTARTRGVIPRWEPHEAHQFTKPYSRRSSKPEWAETKNPVKMSRRATKKPPKTGGGRKKAHN